MQAVRRVLADERPLSDLIATNPIVSPASEALLRAARAEADGQHLAAASSPIVASDGVWQWFTYGGLRANRVIADAVLAPLQIECTVTNTSLRPRSRTLGLTTLREAIARTLESSTLATMSPAVTAASSATVKFGKLLPPEQLATFLRERNYDEAGAVEVLRGGVRVVSSPSN